MTRGPATNTAPGAGLLDTSVLATAEASAVLPEQVLVSTVSLAELASGPHTAKSEQERNRREARLLTAEARYDALPFDAACLRAFKIVRREVEAVGRQVRGRLPDLLIASTAVAHSIPIYTYDTADLRGLESVLEVVDCRVAVPG